MGKAALRPAQPVQGWMQGIALKKEGVVVYYLTLNNLKDTEKLTAMLVGAIPPIVTFVGVSSVLSAGSFSGLAAYLPCPGWAAALLAAVMVKLYSWATKKDSKDYSKKGVEHGSAS